MTDQKFNVEIEREPETDYVGEARWSPCAGLERGTIENIGYVKVDDSEAPTTDDWERITKLKMEAMGISEEFLTGDVQLIPFFDGGFDNRVTVSPARKTFIDETFRRVVKRTMRPSTHCIATRNGVMALGKRFRSLRLARVWYKNMMGNIEIKFADKPVVPDESWVPLAEYGK
jgi:hypothetical protein